MSRDTRKGLTIARQLRRQKEQSAVEHYAGVRQKLDAARSRMAELEQYRSDYETALQHSGSRGSTAAMLFRQRQFLAAIDQAISQQQQLLSQQEQASTIALRQWHTQHNSRQAVDKLLQRKDRNEQQQQQRREQMQQDAFVVSRFQNKTV